MNTRTVSATRILTPQKEGFLTEGPYPFTHTLSWASGCGFGHTYCGSFCYAQTLTNWRFVKEEGENWGDAVVIKENAPDILAEELAALEAEERKKLRLYMSSVTDPYQDLEATYRLSRSFMEIFMRYPEIDLLLIHTRSPTILDDLDRIARLPFAVVAVSLETDLDDLQFGPTFGEIQQRLNIIQAAHEMGIRTQVMVAPCLHHSEEFAKTLAESGADRVVVDTFVEGDGAMGERTARTPFAEAADFDWRSDNPARRLYEQLVDMGVETGWSSAGYAGIPPRHPQTEDASEG
jgi:DNA repair photolyase